jgi:PmbA protein
MLKVDEAEARAGALIDAARKAGADAADVLYAGEASLGISVRLGELEDVGRSEGEEIGLRVFIGQRSASVSSSDLSAAALTELVERAVAMAREAPEDPNAALAAEELLYRGDLLNLESDDGVDPAPGDLKARALATEAAARAVAGITNSEGASASAGRSVVALATSTGFCRGYTSSHHGGSASVIAGEGGAMQRDYASHSARHLCRSRQPRGHRAAGGGRAYRKAAQPYPGVPSGAMPIVFDPRVGGSLIGHLLGAMSGPAVARRTSFLLGHERRRCSPSRPASRRSAPGAGASAPGVRWRRCGEPAAGAGRGGAGDRMASSTPLSARQLGDCRPTATRPGAWAGATRRRRDQRPIWKRATPHRASSSPTSPRAST